MRQYQAQAWKIQEVSANYLCYYTVSLNNHVHSHPYGLSTIFYPHTYGYTYIQTDLPTEKHTYRRTHTRIQTTERETAESHENQDAIDVKRGDVLRRFSEWELVCQCLIL